MTSIRRIKKKVKTRGLLYKPEFMYGLSKVGVAKLWHHYFATSPQFRHLLKAPLFKVNKNISYEIAKELSKPSKLILFGTPIFEDRPFYINNRL